MANSNEIVIKVEVDGRKAAITPPTAAADTFQPKSAITKSADSAIDILGQGEQIISNIPTIGTIYNKGSSLVSQMQNVGNMFATANIVGLVGVGIAAVSAIAEKTTDYIAMKRQTAEIQRRSGLYRGQ